MRRTLLALFLASVFAVGAAWAQPGPAALDQVAPAPMVNIGPIEGDTVATTQARDAALAHAAVKATTYKVGTIAANLAVLSAATGGLVGGTVLTIVDTASGWLIYGVNDYLWDRYSPPPVKSADNQAFSTGQSVRRTTWKYLTFKPVAMAAGWGAIYLYTGSAATMVTYGITSSLAKAAVFYANDLGWDYYDWTTATPETTSKP